MRKFVAVSIALATSAAALADVATTAQKTAVPGLPPGAEAWDLMITVSGNDDWTSASMDSVQNAGGASFLDPNPAVNFYLKGFNDADTWCTSPDPGTLGFASALVVAPGSVKATWFDTGNTGDGSWTIARIVVQPGSPGWTATLKGAHTAKNSQGTLLPYSIVIPEPSTLGLLVLGGLATLIRRR
jgi:hypothetical protein